MIQGRGYHIILHGGTWGLATPSTPVHPFLVTLTFPRTVLGLGLRRHGRATASKYEKKNIDCGFFVAIPTRTQLLNTERF